MAGICVGESKNKLISDVYYEAFALKEFKKGRLLFSVSTRRAWPGEKSMILFETEKFVLIRSVSQKKIASEFTNDHARESHSDQKTKASGTHNLKINLKGKNSI